MSDLSTSRTAIGVISSPIPAVGILGFPWVAKLELPDPVAALAILWFAITVSTYLCLAWWRQVISAIGCILAGGLAGVTFPIALICVCETAPNSILRFLRIIRIAQPIWDFVEAHWLTPQVLLIHAAALAIGMASGWLFWAIAVRPAPIEISLDDVFS